MNPTQSLSTPARIYLALVIVAGTAITIYSAVDLYVDPPPLQWVVLAALTLLTGSFTVKVPSLTARISVSEAFVFTAVVLFGPSVATVIVALDSFVISLWMRPDRRFRVRSLFNLAAVALAIWVSAHAFFALIGAPPGSREFLSLNALAVPLFVLALSYFLWNSWLVAFAVAAERRINPYQFWRNNFPWLSLNYFGGASVAGLLVAYTRSVDLQALGIIIPLLVISYLTYRTSIGRVEDAKLHVEQVNALYMSAVETLAMAVDAKDQITHGHIRRVQVFATELAVRLGVSDENQLKAIQTAALLHDMGKLAIPEHILNKPGKLTKGEFEKMKRHADIGADLLSSIPFPYPVVPIVRHHHENWDGSGYPNGISGIDIPLGARILSVVDCFDALTSDRPYRPRLATEAAFEILRDRRGAMYDPLVVDTFIAAYGAISPAAVLAGQQARSLIPNQKPSSEHATRALDEIQTGSAESYVLAEARRRVVGVTAPTELVSVVSSAIRQFTPATVVALYLYVPHTDTLRCVAATGDPDALLNGFEIPCGERTTGWAAANCQSVLNSAASLDLGRLAASYKPALKSALSVPILGKQGSRGTLTVYSSLDSPFTDRHTFFLEQISKDLRHPLEVGRSALSIVRFPDDSARASERE